ncbi:MAG: hypothetical protein GY941_09040 [Planctomycetes bacterium]|nr:hypothetical protein [Planctomycetota bacterium]
MDTIPIIFEDASDSKSGNLGLLAPKAVIEQVDAGKIRQSMESLTGKISTMLEDIKKVGNFQLKEITLSVEINAEGGVSLIANAKAGIKGAIQLTFSV